MLFNLPEFKTVKCALVKASSKNVNPDPANIFCSDLWLLHIFKCTPDFYFHGSKHYNPLIRLLLREQSDLGPYCL